MRVRPYAAASNSSKTMRWGASDGRMASRLAVVRGSRGRVASGRHTSGQRRGRRSLRSLHVRESDSARPRTTLQDLTDTKSLTNAELKSLATTPARKQYLAFDEMARRIRDNPSGWTQQDEPWAWSAVDCTRGPNAREMEWAFLKWSQRLNDVEPALDQEQEMRIERAGRHPGSAWSARSERISKGCSLVVAVS